MSTAVRTPVLWGVVATTLLGCVTVTGANAAPGPAEKPTPPGATDQALAVDQGRLAARYRRLEQVLLRLAELTAGRNPRRAALLRQAIAQSKERDLPLRFETVVGLLETGRLATADKQQSELAQELEALLQLLRKESHSERLESEQKRVRRYLKQLGRVGRKNSRYSTSARVRSSTRCAFICSKCICSSFFFLFIILVYVCRGRLCRPPHAHGEPCDTCGG